MSAEEDSGTGERAEAEDIDQPEGEPSSSSRPGVILVDLDESESSRSRSPVPRPSSSSGIARPPVPPQALRPTFAFLPELVRVFGYSGHWVEENRILRPTLSEAGTLFIDFHQCLDRSVTRPRPIQGRELPPESVQFLRECRRIFEGIKIYLISHLNADATLQSLLRSLNSTQGSEELLDKVFITPDKVGHRGKIATIRSLVPLASAFLVDDHCPTIVEANSAGCPSCYIYVPGRHDWPPEGVPWRRFLHEALEEIECEKNDPTLRREVRKE